MSSRLESHEIPQADNLDNMRSVVEAVAQGMTATSDIADHTKISSRHVGYAVHAVKSLGWITHAETPSVTESGKALLATKAGSVEERDSFKQAIGSSEAIKVLAPDLLGDKPPSQEELTKRIRAAVPDMSEATADRRAQTLLSWRNQALDEQLPLL